MGNTGSGGKGNYKRKPKRAAASGEQGGVILVPGGGASGGGGNDPLVLNIRLVKLNIPLLKQPAKSDTVELRWASTEYEVFWQGQRLGAVPGNFNDQLQYPESHRGRITNISEQPPAVTIRVTVSR